MKGGDGDFDGVNYDTKKSGSVEDPDDIKTISISLMKDPSHSLRSVRDDASRHFAKLNL